MWLYCFKLEVLNKLITNYFYHKITENIKEIELRSHIQKYANHKICFYKSIVFVGTLKIITIDEDISDDTYRFPNIGENRVPCFVNNIALIIKQMS